MPAPRWRYSQVPSQSDTQANPAPLPRGCITPLDALLPRTQPINVLVNLLRLLSLVAGRLCPAPLTRPLNPGGRPQGPALLLRSRQPSPACALCRPARASRRASLICRRAGTRGQPVSFSSTGCALLAPFRQARASTPPGQPRCRPLLSCQGVCFSAPSSTPRLCFNQWEGRTSLLTPPRALPAPV